MDLETEPHLLIASLSPCHKHKYLIFFSRFAVNFDFKVESAAEL